MELSFMKQSALETLKSNLPKIYPKYFTEAENDWIFEICGEDPFVKFKEISDFELAPLDAELTKGEIDFQNCKTIYLNLKFLSDVQASDERLWAGLSHGIFYSYLRKRWNYLDLTKADKITIQQIRGRFFFNGRVGKELLFNGLARYWWTGKLFYDSLLKNSFEKLDILGSADTGSKIRYILSGYRFSGNPTILNGIVKCFKYFKDKNQPLVNLKMTLQPALSKLNKVGGSVILDCLSEDEIAEILVKEVKKLMAK